MRDIDTIADPRVVYYKWNQDSVLDQFIKSLSYNNNVSSMHEARCISLMLNLMSKNATEYYRKRV